MKNMLNSLWYQVHGVHSLNRKVDFSILNETLASFDTLKHNEQDNVFFYNVHLRSCIIFSSIILGFSFFRFKKHDFLIFSLIWKFLLFIGYSITFLGILISHFMSCLECDNNALLVWTQHNSVYQSNVRFWFYFYLFFNKVRYFKAVFSS